MGFVRKDLPETYETSPMKPIGNMYLYVFIYIFTSNTYGGNISTWNLWVEIGTHNIWLEKHLHGIQYFSYIYLHLINNCIIKNFRNGGTEPYKAILGVGFPLHKPYPYSLHRFSYLHFRYLKCLVTVWVKRR